MAERNTTNLPFTVYSFSTALSAPGTTNTEKKVVSAKSCTFVYTITAIDTNLVVAIEQSADGTNWGIDPLRPAVTHSANGTFTQTWLGASPYVALVFVSESGGDSSGVVTINGAFVQRHN